MLRVENITTGYDKKQVLFDVSFEISKGDIALLIGSNGSGKSTLLKAIYGLCKIWHGKIFFEDVEITNSKPAALVKEGLLYVPQKNNVFEQLTVKENLEISGMALTSKQLFRQRLEQVINYFPGLVTNYKMHPMKMSGGERQQLVLAMAMLHQPKLLLIDEPFIGLTPQAIKHISELLLKLNQTIGVTIIMVEHRIKEALPLTNCLIGLRLGQIVEDIKEMSKFKSDCLNKILI